MMRPLLFGMLVVTVLGATSAFAATSVRTGDQFELAKGQKIDGDFLAIGNPVSISGEVDGDALLLGNQTRMTGVVTGDLLSLGILSRVDGIVSDDVRIVGANVTIAGTVEGDVMVLAGTVDVLSSATIKGDLLLYAGTAAMNGQVGGDVIGSTRTLSIDGGVVGAVDIRTNELALGPNASVTESVRYTSTNLLTQAISSTVGGSILRNDPISRTESRTLFSLAVPFFALLFAAALWYFLSRATLSSVVRQTSANVLRAAITGTIAILITPVIVFVLFLSLVGTPVAILGVLGYLTLLLLAVIALPAVIGFVCMRFTKLSAHHTHTLNPVMLAIGTVICCILWLLPGIGVFVLFFGVVIVFGGLVEALIRASR